MTKPVRIAVIIVIIAGALALWWFLSQKWGKKFLPFGVIPKIVPVSNFIEPASNPLEKVPDLNPVNKANPFTDIYKNPFE